uniref:GPI ethanolamine phosphate transferase 1 n=1 Tax=Elaeophora elaphi TaxID=1147741 RepID=A0A0R3S270_9BILA
MQQIHGKLAMLGVFVHAVLLYSIFDIYYSSPLVTGLHPYSITNKKGLADRLVILSADGLRADTFFNHPEKSPFLHEIINSGKGCWGVSVSHVPTESRPGHVAMLAGFFEDVSAVARGWKHNPVPFDSIINRSREAFAFGSPDVVLMFTNDVSHATAIVYSSRLEDFQQNDAAQLDRWVFRRMEELLNTTDVTITKRLASDRLVFFLHLLGLDTNGHGHKPQSDKYIDNIAVVDTGIAKVVQLLNDFYADNRTAFLFTSDHGMTDWGSHGAGTEAELITPLVIWGRGIRGSTLKNKISQIDLSPLMSALLGCAIPMNSFGTVPLHLLDAAPRYKFTVAYANFKQMLLQFILKKNEKRAHSLPFMFRDFDQFHPNILPPIESEIKRLVTQNRFDAAAAVCMQWIPILRTGLIYFHRHDRTLLGIAVTCTFISWMLCVYFITLRRSSTKLKDNNVLFPSPKQFAIVGSMFSLLLLCGLPFTHALYLTLPIYLSCVFCNTVGDIFGFNLEIFVMNWHLIHCSEMRRKWLLLCICWSLLAILIAVILTVIVSAFIYRPILSVEFLVLGLIPLLRHGESRDVVKWKRIWLICCLVIAIYPQFPVVGQTPLPTVCALSSFFTSLLIFWISTSSMLSSTKLLFRYHSALHLFAAVVVILVDTFQDYKLLLMLLRLICWLSIPVAAVLPLLSSRSVIIRLICWFSSLMLPYALLSLSYESSFMLLLFVLLTTYVRLEFGHMSDDEFLAMSLPERDNETKLIADVSDTNFVEWLQGLNLIILIEAAFFGTGNIASLNSFNPSFLRCFISVFSPFTMATMLIFKISLPILAVAFTYAVIVRLKKILIAKLSMILLIISDTMALIFFFRLVDEGSWLDIGSSISHYSVCMLLTVIVYLLLNLTEYLLPLTLSKVMLNEGMIFVWKRMHSLTLKSEKDIV